MIRSISLLVFFTEFIIYFPFVLSENYICGINENSVVCCSGYKLDENGDCTAPICTNDCGRDGLCIAPDMCKCANGQFSTFCQDEEYNNYMSMQIKDKECPNNCNGFGTCTDGKCICNFGYGGESCSDELEGECYLNITRAVCMKLERGLKLKKSLCCGAFNVAWGDNCKRCEKVKCGKGFIEVNGNCEDINECEIPNICQAGKCFNIRGSFRCQCSSSHQYDPTQVDCVQRKKKCEQFQNLCGPGMECVSLSLYNHYCKCLTGYMMASDGKSCIPSFQMKYNLCTAYGSYLCQFGKCLADGYNYKCECNPGYIPSSDGKSCKKSIDYCSLYSNFLCSNGKCISLSNDFMCQCNPGFTLSQDRKKCTSICDLYPNSLCMNGQCIPQPNHGYECRCNEGYAAIGKGKQCRRIMNDQSIAQTLQSNDDNLIQTNFDIDFCTYSHYSSQCQGGRCINMKNNYYCECLPGFSSDKNGLACKKTELNKQEEMNDASKSIDNRSYCDKFGTLLCTKGRCIESGSSYQCKCDTGYREAADGKSCYDINECSMNPSICKQGTCTNSPGSYQCSCYDGFTIYYIPGGPRCYDRNECDEDKSLCKNGKCVNTWGSFRCECNSGYLVSVKKQHCIPVQQMQGNGKNVCDSCHHKCEFVNGSKWQCVCAKGMLPVLNIGLCAPVNQIERTRLDFEANINLGNYQSRPNTKTVYFELLPGVESEEFRSRLTSLFNNISIDYCIFFDKTQSKSGVLCYYSVNP